MKTLLSLASHIWYYKVTVTIFLKKCLFAWKETLTIIIWKIAWLAWKGLLLRIDLSGTCVPRIWRVWNKFLCFNSVCLFALAELQLYNLYSCCKVKSLCLLLPKFSCGCCLGIAKVNSCCLEQSGDQIFYFSSYWHKE